MATATGDILFDFKVLPDQSPYTPSGFTNILGTGQIVSGDLRSSTAGAVYRIGYTNSTSNTDIVRVTVEMGFDDADAPNDAIGIRLLTTDWQNGYSWSIRGAFSFYRRVDSGSFVGSTNPSTSGFNPGDTFALEYQKSTGRVEGFKNGVSVFSVTDTTHSARTFTIAAAIEPTSGSTAGGISSLAGTGFATTTTLRKGSQFTVANTIGVIAGATLNGNAITVNSQTSNTVTLTDTGSGITTSGSYSLVLTDDTGATETISVQVDVYGVVPSDNPVQKDGTALVNLTGVQVLVTDGSSINGATYYYTSSGTTDASGNLSNIDVSSSSAVEGEAVLLHIRTASGDSISATEAVELI